MLLLLLGFLCLSPSLLPLVRTPPKKIPSIFTPPDSLPFHHQHLPTPNLNQVQFIPNFEQPGRRQQEILKSEEHGNVNTAVTGRQLHKANDPIRPLRPAQSDNIVAPRVSGTEEPSRHMVKDFALPKPQVRLRTHNLLLC